jgi:inner membrane protein
VPGLGHLAVGLAAARVTMPPPGLGPWRWTLLLVGASFAPDADIVAFSVGIPYGSPLGHRGALHSIFMAGVCGGVLGLVARWRGFSPLPIVLGTSAVMASHGILDAFTDGGRGVALLWPLGDARYFAPWRPIPVSPLGMAVFSAHGLRVMCYETLLFLPLFAVAAWPRGAARHPERERAQCRDE